VVLAWWPTGIGRVPARSSRQDRFGLGARYLRVSRCKPRKAGAIYTEGGRQLGAPVQRQADRLVESAMLIVGCPDRSNKGQFQFGFASFHFHGILLAIVLQITVLAAVRTGTAASGFHSLSINALICMFDVDRLQVGLRSRTKVEYLEVVFKFSLKFIFISSLLICIFDVNQLQVVLRDWTLEGLVKGTSQTIEF